APSNAGLHPHSPRTLSEAVVCSYGGRPQDGWGRVVCDYTPSPLAPNKSAGGSSGYRGTPLARLRYHRSCSQRGVRALVFSARMVDERREVSPSITTPTSRSAPEVRVRRIHRRDLNRAWEFLKLCFRDVNRETVEYQRPRSKSRFL